MDNNKKETWKWLINLIVSILTALAAALGTTSCIQQVAKTEKNDIIWVETPDRYADFAQENVDNYE